MATAIEKLLFKIRSAESPFWARIKVCLLRIMRLDLNIPKFLMKPVYNLLIMWRFGSAFLLEKLIYVPIFKARCDQCGRGLLLGGNGVPWIEGQMTIRLGDHVSIDGCAFSSGHVYSNPELSIGDRTMIGFKTQISVSEQVRIGKDCLVAAGCFIADNDGHPMDPQRRLNKCPVNLEEISPVSIEDNVWIGRGAVILKGVTIGEGSIIGANSVVTRSIPPYSIAMGVPARVVISGIDRAFRKDANQMQ